MNRQVVMRGVGVAGIAGLVLLLIAFTKAPQTAAAASPRADGAELFGSN